MDLPSNTSAQEEIHLKMNTHEKKQKLRIRLQFYLGTPFKSESDQKNVRKWIKIAQKFYRINLSKIDSEQQKLNPEIMLQKYPYNRRL